MKDFKSVANTIWYHSKIMLKGLKRTVLGAATAGLIALAAYGFWMIPSEDGYVAVCEFIVATCTVGVAMTSMYAMGAGVKKGARR